MPQYNKVDITVSASGDLSIDSNRDFLVGRGKTILKQDVAFRVRTNPGEFIPHLELGAGLSDIVGEPNTRETARLGETKITNSLVYDGMVGKLDLYTRGVPVSQEALMYYVFINNGQTQLNVTPEVIFTLTNGLKNIPGA